MPHYIQELCWYKCIFDYLIAKATYYFCWKRICLSSFPDVIVCDLSVFVGVCRTGWAAVQATVPGQLFVQGGSAWCSWTTLSISVASGRIYHKMLLIPGNLANQRKVFETFLWRTAGVNPAHVEMRLCPGLLLLWVFWVFGEGQMMSPANLDTCGISCISFRTSATFIKTFQGFLNAS